MTPVQRPARNSAQYTRAQGRNEKEGMTTENETYYPSRTQSTKWKGNSEQKENICTSFIWLETFTQNRRFLRNLYAGQETTVRNGHGTKDWFQIRKGVHQGCILSPCLFNFYVEYIMRNVRLDEAQAEIKIARRNINNLRYADDTTLMQKAKRNQTAWWKWKRRVKKLA